MNGVPGLEAVLGSAEAVAVGRLAGEGPAGQLPLPERGVVPGDLACQLVRSW